MLLSKWICIKSLKQRIQAPKCCSCTKQCIRGETAEGEGMHERANVNGTRADRVLRSRVSCLAYVCGRLWRTGMASFGAWQATRSQVLVVPAPDFRYHVMKEVQRRGFK